MNERLSLFLVGVMALGGCGEAEQKEPISIGLVAPKSGALAFVGLSFERVFLLAVDEINARGGVNGHELVPVVKDSATDPDTAAARLLEMIDEGVVAVVGPATSGEVTASFPIARDSELVIISPSATSPELTDAIDGGFMFRNVPNDNIQGIAMAHYLRSVAEPPAAAVAVVYEDTPYGVGLATSFKDSFVAQGGTIIGEVTFEQNQPQEDTSLAAQQVIDDLQALDEEPALIVMVALEGDGLAIVQAWADSGALASADWFLTDGARSTGFLQDLPAQMVGMRGTAPTFPTLGDAFGELSDAFTDAHGTDVGQEVFAPNVWDATYLIAAGLVKQEADGAAAFGGPGLRDAIIEVSRGPGVILHAGQWRDITTSINSGNDVDYDGAAGPNDFDEAGEALGPYEVWEIVDSGSAMTFQQVLFLEPDDLEGLIDEE